MPRVLGSKTLFIYLFILLEKAWDLVVEESECTFVGITIGYLVLILQSFLKSNATFNNYFTTFL